MRKQRKLETPEDRNQRLVREAQRKKDEIRADEITVDKMITRNIAQYGP